MYNALVIGVFLIVLGLMLVHWKGDGLPGIEPFADATGATSGKKAAGAVTEGFRVTTPDGRTLVLPHFMREGFAAVAVDPARVPACVARSAPAQALLARFATIPASDDAAEELRLLVSKLCCIEADIKTPAAGVYRTATLQFRTSHDMEPASTLVGRCLAGAVQPRDVVLIMDKFNKRGGELIKSVLGGCPEAAAEFAAVSNTTRVALSSCCRPAPTMDHPLGARDLGFWEPERVADLSQYQGISAVPK